MTYGRPDFLNIECRSNLRKLELEAYSSLINAFRAQGNFSKEKKTILNELRCFLSITIERHQAEIRRAINDEKLSKISTNLNGEDLLDAWIIEGRRLIPLLKRMPPKTGVSNVADSIARYQVKQNELEPLNKNHNDKIKVKQPTVTIEDPSFLKLIANKSHPNNQSVPRKRLNSFESFASKRKCTEDKSKQPSTTQKNAQVRLPSSVIPLNQIKQVENKALVLNEKQQQQPKLLIMSTGSVINTSNKSIVNTIAHPQNSLQNIITSSDQLIKLERVNDESNKNKTSSKATLVATQSPSSIKTLTSSTSNDIPVSLVTTSSAKIYNPKVQNTANLSSKLMFLPNNTQGKTLTIPINHNVKTFQLPTQNSTIFYSTQQLVNSTTANALNKTTLVPGITIQAIKTAPGNKSNNFIIMPNKATANVSTTNAQQISQAQLAGAKGLLRQMNAKEFPLKFISTTAASVNASNSKKDDKTGVNQFNESVSNLANERQPTIILTNLSKETANSLTGNLVNKNQQGNIIKVIPKSSAGGTSTAKFMEILKKTIPANRISVSSGQLANNKPASNDLTSNQSGPNKTINLVHNSVSNPTMTKALKIPTATTTASEPITKLIISSVNSNQCSPVVNIVNNVISSSNDSSNKQTDSSASSSLSISNEQIKDSSLPISIPISSTENSQTNPLPPDSESKLDLVQKALDSLNKDDVVESTT